MLVAAVAAVVLALVLGERTRQVPFLERAAGHGVAGPPAATGPTEASRHACRPDGVLFGRCGSVREGAELAAFHVRALGQAVACNPRHGWFFNGG